MKLSPEIEPYEGLGELEKGLEKELENTEIADFKFDRILRRSQIRVQVELLQAIVDLRTLRRTRTLWRSAIGTASILGRLQASQKDFPAILCVLLKRGSLIVEFRAFVSIESTGR